MKICVKHNATKITPKTIVAININFSAPLLTENILSEPPKTEERPPPRCCKIMTIINKIATIIVNILSNFISLYNKDSTT